MTDTNSQATRSQGINLGNAQLDPNSKNGFDYTVYELTATLVGGSTAIGEALSVATANGGYASGEEYWNLSSQLLDACAAGRVTALQFSAVSGNWSAQPNPPGWGGSSQSPTMASSVSWTGLQQTTPPSGTLYTGYKGIKISGTTTAPVVKWYLESTGTPPTGTYVVNENGATFTNTAPATQPGMSWYTVA